MVKFCVGQHWYDAGLQQYAEVVGVSDGGSWATVVVTSPDGRRLDQQRVDAGFQDIWQLVRATPEQP